MRLCSNALNISILICFLLLLPTAIHSLSLNSFLSYFKRSATHVDESEGFCPDSMEELCTEVFPENGAAYVCYRLCTRSGVSRHKVPINMCMTERHLGCSYCKCRDGRFMDIDSQECLTKAECMAKPKYGQDYDESVSDRGYVLKTYTG